jgi:hypothetical protein
MASACSTWRSRTWPRASPPPSSSCAPSGRPRCEERSNYGQMARWRYGQDMVEYSQNMVKNVVKNTVKIWSKQSGGSRACPPPPSNCAHRQGGPGVNDGQSVIQVRTVKLCVKNVMESYVCVAITAVKCAYAVVKLWSNGKIVVNAGQNIAGDSPPHTAAVETNLDRASLTMIKQIC